MVLLLIGIAILIYAIFDYYKAFYLYLVYQLFWCDQLAVIQAGGRTVFISTFMNTVFFALYFIKKKTNKHQSKRFPFTIPYICLVFSMMGACFFAVAGFFSELSRQITVFFRDFLIIWLIWKNVETKKDFNFVIKGITVVMFFACIFGLIEYAIQANPFFDYKSSIAFIEIKNYNYMVNSFSAMARGYRLYSIFEHPIGGGMIFGLYFAFVLNLYVKREKNLPWKQLALITAFLCIPCVILTKMRSAYIFMIIASLSIFDFRKKRFYILACVMVIFAIISWPVISSNFDIFASLFSKKLQKTVGGSGLAQRLGQFSAVFSLMEMSPLFGLGEKFKDLISNSYTEPALSYESLWLLVMPRYGMIGVIAYIIYGFFSVFIIPRKYHSKEILFIMLAYWITYTITSIPSFRTSILFVVIFYYIKTSNAYKKSYCRFPNVNPQMVDNKNVRNLHYPEKSAFVMQPLE